MSEVPEGGGEGPSHEASTEAFFPGGLPPPHTLPLRLDFLERGAAVGRYVILGRLGAGGMGVVYAAYDPELDRKVALKLLRPDRSSSGDAARLRLLREAQAIARLSHPNVIAVFDAGSFGDQVFIAMEFVEGWTLRQWIGKKEPSWREILGRFVLAGRGLAAAHAAGLMHRDFKPDNVLLGKDGRVRVVDFGIARPMEGSETLIEGEGSLSGSGSILATPLTQGGVALGTPPYMSPEQLRGEAADARTDQFSFCVSLYEALYGERPFPGTETRQVIEAVRRGMVRAEPAATRVPRHLRAVLLRGLRASPSERYPSMEELLHDLERDPAAVRRRWLAAAVAILVTGAVFSGFGYFQAGRQRLCGGAEEKMAEIWNADRKSAIHTAFLATRAPYAESAWKSVGSMIDGYATGWSRMRREACEATRLRGEQSEDLLDRRMLCLDQRLEEVRALTALFTRADAQVVEKAVQAAAGLGRLERCADVQALTARVPLPADRRLRARVEAVQRDLARAKALRAAGKYGDGLAVARQVSGRTADLPYRPVQAEALYHLGDLQEKAGLFAPAERTLRQAVARAEAAGDDEVKARSAIALLHVLGEDQERFDRANEWEELVAGILERLSGNDELRAEFANELGFLYEAEGRYAESLAKHREAAAIRRRLSGEREPGVAAAIGNAGVALYGLGRYPEALASFQEALRIQEAALGPQHPEVGDTLNRIGAALLAQGRYEDAIRWFRKALAVREAALGPEHRLVADVLSNLGSSLDSIARYDEARQYLERALKIRLQIFGRDHPAVAASLDNLGSVEANQRRWQEALSHHRQALEVRLATQGREHPKTALSLHNIGNVFNLQGRYAEALPYFRRALAIEEKALGGDHPDVAEELTAVADIERRLGRPARALGPLERALKIVESQELEPGVVARTRFALAQTLWETGGDRDRALRLAQLARDAFLALGEQEKVALDEVRQWLSHKDRVRRDPLG
jgi:eukaryotic-like serine/threonine-protein kinase